MTDDTEDLERKKEKRRGRKRPEAPSKGGPKSLGGKGSHVADNVFKGAFGAEKDDRPRSSPAAVPPGGRKGAENDERSRSVHVHLGKRWSEIVNAIKAGEYTWEEFAASLSPEELARGQLKTSAGDFRGRPPSLVPRAFYNACVRELMARGQESWKQNYLGAIEAMTEIAQDKTAKAGDRIKAAQFVVERIEGKVPDRLIVDSADPWQDAIDGILADVDDQAIAHARQYLARMEQQGQTSNAE